MKLFKYLLIFGIIFFISLRIFIFYFGNQAIGILFLFGWAIFEYAIKAPPIIFFKKLGFDTGYCQGYDIKIFEPTTLGWTFIVIWNILLILILFLLLRKICISFGLLKKKNGDQRIQK